MYFKLEIRKNYYNTITEHRNFVNIHFGFDKLLK